jgi:hypothetical protein
LRYPRANSKCQHRSGSYGYLRYVCRQIRKEYTPIYAAKTTVLVRQPTANQFIATFHPRVLKTILRHSARTTCVKLDPFTNIVPEIADDIHIVSYFGYPLDVTMLIRLCQQMSKTRIKFKEASASLRLADELDEFFACVSRGTFCPDLENIFYRIKIQNSRKPIIMFQFYQSCMQYGLKPNYEGRDARALLESVGVPKMGEFGVKFISYGKGLA